MGYMDICIYTPKKKYQSLNQGMEPSAPEVKHGHISRSEAPSFSKTLSKQRTEHQEMKTSSPR